MQSLMKAISGYMYLHPLCYKKKINVPIYTVVAIKQDKIKQRRKLNLRGEKGMGKEKCLNLNGSEQLLEKGFSVFFL